MEVCWLPARYFHNFWYYFLHQTGIRTDLAKSYAPEEVFNNPDLMLNPEKIAEVSHTVLKGIRNISSIIFFAGISISRQPRQIRLDLGAWPWVIANVWSWLLVISVIVTVRPAHEKWWISLDAAANTLESCRHSVLCGALGLTTIANGESSDICTLITGFSVP